MHVQFIGLDLDHGGRDVRAMAGHSFITGQDVFQKKACLHGAAAAPQADDVALLHFHDEVIDHFCQRFYIGCGGCITLIKSILCTNYYIMKCNSKGIQFAGSILCKCKSL